MPLSNLIVLAAIQMEQRAILREFREANIDLPVELVGIRAGRLPRIAFKGGVCILAGVAGALDPSLRIGDVVLDDERGMVPREIVDRLRLKVGRIHTAERVVSTPAEKAHLFRETGALAVDMEQAAVRRAAANARAIFIGVRAISDTADEVLDPRVVHLVDALGRPRPAKIAATLLKSPSLIPYLNQLGKNSKKACENLGPAVQAIVNSQESRPVPGPEFRAGDGPALPRNER